MLLRITWPIFFARSSCGYGRVPDDSRRASIFFSARSRTESACGTRHPVDVLTRVQTQIGQNDGDERVRGGSYPINRYPLPFQIPYRADPIRPKQLEAADVDSCEYHNRFPCIETQNSWPHESHADVGLTGGQQLTGFGICLAAPLTYWTSANPSPRSSSSAKYRGAQQAVGERTSLSFVVSGGGSAASELDCNPSSAPVPASAAVPRNSLRLQLLCRLILM